MNISKMSSQELRQLAQDVERELKKRRKDEVKAAQRELKAVAERYGFGLNELVGAGGVRGESPARGVPRFRHPDDDSKTWSGRGRKPSWVKEWEATGRALSDLQIG